MSTTASHVGEPILNAPLTCKPANTPSSWLLKIRRPCSKHNTSNCIVCSPIPKPGRELPRRCQCVACLVTSSANSTDTHWQAWPDDVCCVHPQALRLSQESARLPTLHQSNSCYRVCWVQIDTAAGSVLRETARTSESLSGKSGTRPKVHGGLLSVKALPLALARSGAGPSECQHQY